MRVLIVEDTPDIAANIGDYLTIKGFQTDFAYRGEAALQRIHEARFDVIILDVMMPGMDGLSVCEAMRNEHLLDTPILFLTARDTLDDKLAGFAAGGDDYLVKPFAMAELEARLNALILRHQGQRQKTLAAGPLTLNLSTQEAFYQQKSLQLDQVQFRLLQHLIRQYPGVAHKKDLEYALWQDEDIEGSALRTHIYRLRKALPGGVLETVRGAGYRLNVGV